MSFQDSWTTFHSLQQAVTITKSASSYSLVFSCSSYMFLVKIERKEKKPAIIGGFFGHKSWNKL